jgi:hypothetical protein
MILNWCKNQVNKYLGMFVGGFADFGNFGNTASSTQQTPSFPQSGM